MNTFAYIVVFCAFSAAILQGALAAVYVVGDATGWTIPPNGANTYTNWASGKTFSVGDILVFNFVTNQHDVLQVPKASYDGCTSNNAIGSMITNGPANVTLNSAGEHYYICSFSGHCTAGQKLAISVSGSGTPGTNPPTTSPAPTTPTTPTTPAPASNQPGACAPTPSPAPKAHGPVSSTPEGPTTAPPPPPPSSSTAVFASLSLAFASAVVGFFL